MITGLIADIHDNKPVDFRRFALQCARHMGIFASFRDGSAPLPDVIKAHPHHREELTEARAEVARLERMTDAEADGAANFEYERDLAYVRRLNSETEARVARYKNILDEVVAWRPPSEGHGCLRTFMIQQLHYGIEWDALRLPEPVLFNGTKWREERLTEAKRDVAYHEKELAAEQQQAERATRWLSALKASLPDELVRDRP